MNIADGAQQSPPEIQSFAGKVISNVERVILGKHEEVRLVLVCLLCEGHLLVEDVPGVGKTMLARAIAKSLGCSFARIQFTPDLLPSDIVGVNIYNQKMGDFEFRPGAIHHQIVLADEINRATPKTQSALLECMEEGQITLDGVTRIMPRPFLVVATQNPVEYEGTFPLPESQLDRFMMRVHLGYPSFEAENQILLSQQKRHPIGDLAQVVTAEELRRMQEFVKDIHVDPSLREYMIRIVQETRTNGSVYLGASPRGSLALFKAAQALAALEGRDFILPDDVKKVAIPALSHRLIARMDRGKGKGANDVIAEIVGRLPVPQ